jgi:hypothetical protein
VVAAVALAISAASAYAQPFPTQLPGQGLIRAVNPGTTITSTGGGTGQYLLSSGTVGGQVYNGTMAAPYNPGGLQLNNAGTIARAVIRWGGNGASLDTYNPAGFNVGSNAAIYFTSSTGVTDAAVLNVDASGNISQIFGVVYSSANGKTGTGVAITGAGTGAAPKIFISNGNGIIVGPTGQISSPTGVGLIGANLNNPTAEFEFVGNFGAAPTYTNGFLDVAGAQSKVWIQKGGFIDGGFTLVQNPAAFTLLVGADVVNAGVVYASQINVVAGLRAVTSTDTVNGVTGVTVDRLFSIDAVGSGGHMAAGPDVCGIPGCYDPTFTNPTAVFNNDGALISKNGYIHIDAANGIRSGTLGSLDQGVGLFADSNIELNVMNTNGLIELYNVVGRFTVTPNVFIDHLLINGANIAYSNVEINALTRASGPSSITTNNYVEIFGNNVNIDSTINHSNTLGFTNSSDTSIFTIGSLNITKSVGAGASVNLENSGAGGINIASTADIISNVGGTGPDGGVFVTNVGANSPTTIAGRLISSFANGGNVEVSVNGPLNISGSMFGFKDVDIQNNRVGASTVITSPNIGDSGPNLDNFNVDVIGPLSINSTVQVSNNVHIFNTSLASGNTTTIAGVIVAGNFVDIENQGATNSNLVIPATIVGQDVNVFSHGNLTLGPTGAFDDVTVTVDGLNSWLTGPVVGLNNVTYTAWNAMTKVATAAVITSPVVDLNILSFKGVQNSGADYTSSGQQPVFQIQTDFLNLQALGSINSPLTALSNPLGNWLLNSMWVKPYNPGDQIVASITANGGGFQAINLGFRGDVAVNSWNTLTPFFLVGYVSPVIIPPFLQGNLGSSLIVQADGNIDIFAGNVPGFSPQFLFPGGVAFVSNAAAGYVSINTNINNAWTFVGAPFQGQWFQGANIFDHGYHATNSNAYINYSVYPATGPGTAYVISQPSPGLFQFVPFQNAVHNNTYSQAIVGGPICNVPNPPAPWPPAGC